jgi:hypothetical protein
VGSRYVSLSSAGVVKHPAMILAELQDTTNQTKIIMEKIKSQNIVDNSFFTIIVINKSLVHTALTESDWIFISAGAVSYLPRIVWLTIH